MYDKLESRYTSTDRIILACWALSQYIKNDFGILLTTRGKYRSYSNCDKNFIQTNVFEQFINFSAKFTLSCSSVCQSCILCIKRQLSKGWIPNHHHHNQTHQLHHTIFSNAEMSPFVRKYVLHFRHFEKTKCVRIVCSPCRRSQRQHHYFLRELPIDRTYINFVWNVMPILIPMLFTRYLPFGTYITTTNMLLFRYH